MPLTEKQKKWRNDWEKANRCVLGCKVHRDYAAHAKQVVTENGDTVSGVLKKPWTPTWKSTENHSLNDQSPWKFLSFRGLWFLVAMVDAVDAHG